MHLCRASARRDFTTSPRAQNSSQLREKFIQRVSRSNSSSPIANRPPSIAKWSVDVVKGHLRRTAAELIFKTFLSDCLSSNRLHLLDKATTTSSSACIKTASTSSSAKWPIEASKHHFRSTADYNNFGYQLTTLCAADEHQTKQAASDDFRLRSPTVRDTPACIPVRCRRDNSQQPPLI